MDMTEVQRKVVRAFCMTGAHRGPLVYPRAEHFSGWMFTRASYVEERWIANPEGEATILTCSRHRLEPVL